MAFIYKNGKVEDLNISDIKLPKALIKKIDNNTEAKKVLIEASETIKKAKVVYAF